MINNITSASPHVFVNNGWNATPYVNMSAPSAGMMRYNGNSSSIEVYDGTSWLQLSGGSASIETSSSFNETINWAQAKMAEERKLEELCKRFPALQKAKENFDLIRTLVENEIKSETV